MELEGIVSGHIRKGDTVIYGYYSQTGLQLKEDKRVLDLITRQLPELEGRKAALAEKLNKGSNNHEELMQWSREVEELNNEIDEKSMRWLELSE
jgi:hypothetical protein